MNTRFIFLQSKVFKAIVIGIGIFVVLLVVFRAGMIAGYRRATFAENWGRNYERNFLGPRQGPMMAGFRDRDFVDAHGTLGVLIKIATSTITVKSNITDNTEKVFVINKNTAIHRFRDIISISDLKINDNVVIVGSPNSSGQIDARLIRVMPSGF